MNPELEKKLLKDKRVIDEIQRHLWIESEKAGFDKGLDWAKADWLEKFSRAWMDYHMPQQKNPSERNAATDNNLSRKSSLKKYSIF